MTLGLERRRQQRSSVLKRAQLACGAALYDCFILDSSEAGVRVQMSAPVALPERLVLRLEGGISIPAVHRWSRGSDAGLEFTPDSATGRGPIAERIWSVHEMLQEGRTDAALRQLRTAAFFADPALEQALEDVEAARARLAGALRAAAIAAS
ncbi:hypothetical protein DFH01_11995 [Falsiroseomonas bella]|uniref:PilZ domain-containing protein n=1 Tax=Falsiroseomonas bella TaxID=2184016 RepID=A0A317FGR4_9PROT|nr:PilZ domain-containing protein [Falsiroseomonas bella]PWS37542.1 hypothetical protein DFH01_11995 [Falsiroseomonas bella]